MQCAHINFLVFPRVREWGEGGVLPSFLYPVFPSLQDCPSPRDSLLGPSLTASPEGPLPGATPPMVPAGSPRGGAALCDPGTGQHSGVLLTAMGTCHSFRGPNASFYELCSHGPSRQRNKREALGWLQSQKELLFSSVCPCRWGWAAHGATVLFSHSAFCS